MRGVRKRFVIWITYRGMARVALGIIAVSLTVLLLTQEVPASRTWTYWTLPLSGKIIAIDAGHGGADGGAVSKQGVVEKDLNLAIALQLRDYLQQSGAIVVMTREGDYDLANEGTSKLSKRKTEDLVKRAQFIKDKKASVFISIHMNSIPSPRWSGAQTFFYPNNSENALLASLVQDEIKRNLENTQRVAATVNTIYLLKAIEDIPSILVEVGFLSNPGEAARLTDSNYQKKVAASIYQGILRYSSGEKWGTDKSNRQLK
ncbi:germination-specific N-acetylmuramoyl-L-alanine amidase [Paenibacillus baekrokdamisoli]|uniref:Germination-specific N-acetylmuramoyl-L-alanine amidase n=1 Tax=Paenibacillus baekrokdamisoli TaxID=1712516 RepID=A0A3G9JDN1_9BACL|nr:N-acetylmuramoyl-L-alanine amidase CwlD [Paenibacillus baekrokdamisoli]MBB3073088.1 N-acetylmuramoyl-L-alanine amidase [Paenibacillus baekrokdamisoli]BBH24031.1 germination-specific N-acetylmuramoyl-L-alanine amidase [Paenibacillus baekrokdamisoli]